MSSFLREWVLNFATMLVCFAVVIILAYAGVATVFYLGPWGFLVDSLAVIALAAAWMTANDRTAHD
jgi:hypothetical protein